MEDELLNTNESTTKETMIFYLRWIVLLPGALVGSWIAYAATKLVIVFGAFFVGQSEGFFTIFYNEFLASFAMGAAFIYSGSYIAPKHKRYTAVTMIGILLMLMGALVLASIWISEYFTLWAVFGHIAGAAYLTIAIWNNNISQLYEDIE